MRIAFTTPVVDEDGTRSGLTVDHIVLYPPDLPGTGTIVINGKRGCKTILIKNLSVAGKKALQDFLVSLAEEAK